MQTATLSTPDPARTDAKEAPDSVNAVDSCPVPEICIDQYLWSLYQRAPKGDTIKVVEQRKVTVIKKGKLRTIIQENYTSSFARISHGRIPRRQKKPACH